MITVRPQGSAIAPLLETRPIFHGRKRKQKQHPKLASCFEIILVNLVPPLRSFLHLSLPFELAFEVSTRLIVNCLFLYGHHPSFIEMMFNSNMNHPLKLNM